MGVVRVSQTGGREGESFRSPAQQRERIEQACERDGIEVVEIYDELDVSGGAPLVKRPGLSLAVDAVERGLADVLMVAYFDRLVRSLKVQAEVIERVEAAGGNVLALDHGQITAGTAAQWLSGTAVGMVSEYMRRSSGERNRAAQEKAVAAGVIPFGSIPPGYIKGPDKKLVVDPDVAPLIVEAYKMRAEGSPIKPIREFLRSHGIERSHHGTQHLFGQRLYLGEIHFGDLVNTRAHEPIIDRGMFERVQRITVPRGRRAKSPHLLSRLGVLRCGTCGSRMSIGTQRQNGRTYRFFKCNPTSDCPRRMAIGADIAEGVVVEAVRHELSGREGRAAISDRARQAEADLERAQDELDTALLAFTTAGMKDESAAVRRLSELRDVRDKAQWKIDQLGPQSSSRIVRAGADWDEFTIDAKRAIIRATIEQVTVGPGRGAGRLTVHLFG